jgi:glucose/arabinose dehydrogenase
MVAHQLVVPTGSGAREATLWLAPGFDIQVFAAGLPDARMLAESPSGELVLSQDWQGRVVKLADRDRDGGADEVVPILSGLDIPHGLAFAGDVLFVAETGRVLRLEPWWDGASAREIIRLPAHGHHETRSLVAGPDGRLYVSVGSSCDACIESDPMRASVWRFNLDGSGGEQYAAGIRNAVGLAWEPGTDRLWVTENGRNDLGEALPPDELNLLRPGVNYGWPSCYGQRVAARAGDPGQCAETEPAALDLPAHSAPLGLSFASRADRPDAEGADLLIALHGAASRSVLLGYEVVRVPIRDGQPGTPVEFVRGWLEGNEAWGKPVHPFMARDGTLYLTDDTAGVIYRIARTGR